MIGYREGNWSAGQYSNMLNQATNMESPESIARRNGIREGRNQCIEIFKKYALGDPGFDFEVALKALAEMKEVGK